MAASTAGIDLERYERAVILEGWRASPPCAVAALENLLLRISAMTEDLPQITELDLNPLKALERGKGCAVVDVRVLLNEPV